MLSYNYDPKKPWSTCVIKNYGSSVEKQGLKHNTNPGCLIKRRVNAYEQSQSQLIKHWTTSLTVSNVHISWNYILLMIIYLLRISDNLRVSSPFHVSWMWSWQEMTDRRSFDKTAASTLPSNWVKSFWLWWQIPGKSLSPQALWLTCMPPLLHGSPLREPYNSARLTCRFPFGAYMPLDKKQGFHL